MAGVGNYRKCKQRNRHGDRVERERKRAEAAQLKRGNRTYILQPEPPPPVAEAWVGLLLRGALHQLERDLPKIRGVEKVEISIGVFLALIKVELYGGRVGERAADAILRACSELRDGPEWEGDSLVLFLSDSGEAFQLLREIQKGERS